MKNVYTLKNNLTKTFSDPLFRFEDFKTLSKQMHDFIILYPDKAKEQHLQLSTLYQIGVYDEETGFIDLFGKEQYLEYNLQEAADQLAALKEQING